MFSLFLLGFPLPEGCFVFFQLHNPCFVFISRHLFWEFICSRVEYNISVFGEERSNTIVGLAFVEACGES